MFKLCFFLLLLAMSVGFAIAKSKPKVEKNPPVSIIEYSGPKKRIAVMDLELKTVITNDVSYDQNGSSSTTTINIPPPTDFGTGMSEMLITALVSSKRFIVLERKSMEDIQTEKALNNDADFDPDGVVAPGNLLGAQALVRGAITEYSYNRSSIGGSTGFWGITLGRNESTASVTLDIRLYDVKTSQIIDSVKAEGKAKGSSNDIGYDKKKNEYSDDNKDFNIAMSSANQTPLGKATRQAIEIAVAKIIEKLEKITWECAIAEIDNADTDPKTTLYLNAGSDMGLKVDDILDVYRAGRPIKDPITKIIIGNTKGPRLGSCKVISVEPSIAVAIPIDGTDFQKEDVIRFPVPSKDTRVETAPVK